MHASVDQTSAVTAAFVAYLEDTLISSFNHSLSGSRQVLTSTLLMGEPISPLGDPVLVAIDRIYRFILAPLHSLSLHPLVSGFQQLHAQVLAACASVDRLFPGAGSELQAVWSARLSSPGEWMLDFPLCIGTDVLLPGFPTSSAVARISDHQRSLLLTPFRKLRRDVGRWLSLWVRARLAADEAEREVRTRLRSELLLEFADLPSLPVVAFPHFN